jgi:hypothetical protein
MVFETTAFNRSATPPGGHFKASRSAAHAVGLIGGFGRGRVEQGGCLGLAAGDP